MWRVSGYKERLFNGLIRDREKEVVLPLVQEGAQNRGQRRENGERLSGEMWGYQPYRLWSGVSG